MADEQLIYLTADEALRRFRSGKLSPVELMDAIAARTERVEPAITANAKVGYESFEAEGKSMPSGLSWCMTYPFNMLSRCPVLAVPSGFGETGVPTGIQIVGKTYDDVSVFRAAAAFEQASPWLHDSAHRPSL